jgi:hypothetical protein
MTALHIGGEATRTTRLQVWATMRKGEPHMSGFARSGIHRSINRLA